MSERQSLNYFSERLWGLDCFASALKTTRFRPEIIEIRNDILEAQRLLFQRDLDKVRKMTKDIRQRLNEILNNVWSKN